MGKFYIVLLISVDVSKTIKNHKPLVPSMINMKSFSCLIEIPSVYQMKNTQLQVYDHDCTVDNDRFSIYPHLFIK